MSVSADFLRGHQVWCLVSTGDFQAVLSLVAKARWDFDGG